jgi:hypothetical protein
MLQSGEIMKISNLLAPALRRIPITIRINSFNKIKAINEEFQSQLESIHSTKSKSTITVVVTIN